MAVGFTFNGIAAEDYLVKKDLFSDGGLWGFGGGAYGNLGDNTNTGKSSPVQTISAGSNWKQVSVGSMTTAAIKTDGTLWLWGYNDSGQIGAGYAGTGGVSSPVQTISSGTDWKQVECGYKLTAAIKTDGTLWLWGTNNDGEIGNNTSISKSSPVQTIAGGSNWKQVSITSTGQTTAAIKTDGTLWLWGYGGLGQMGNNTSTLYNSSPVQTVSGGTDWKQVSSGDQVAAIKTDGTLWLWGYNNNGQLGNGTTTRTSSPIQTVAGGTNWKQVSCGQYYVAAIKTDGTLWTWGLNISGALGDNTVTKRSSPVQTIAAGTNWKQIAAGRDYMAAIKTDGTLWTWGGAYNVMFPQTQGELGDGTTVYRSSPVQTISGGTNWKNVDAGGWGSGYANWTFAIRENYY
jgi:alpha-tubulin suppressor-like RCC1 family protein